LTLNLDNFLVYNAIFPIQHVFPGDDSEHPINGKGIVFIMTSKGELKKKNVLHVPFLTNNL
jgi:hypothetical protein